MRASKSMPSWSQRTWPKPARPSKRQSRNTADTVFCILRGSWGIMPFNRRKPKMKLPNKLLVVFVCAFASSALAVYKVQTVPEMVKAANNLLVTLNPQQNAKARFAFMDKERMNFHFTPGPWNGVARKGLPLKEMRPEQVKLAHALLATA